MDKLKVIKDEKPWYKQGLKFKCTECGKCCTGKNGYVWLSESEVDNISKYLKISKKEFLAKYARLAYGRLSLIDANKWGDCIFLKNNKCEIYPVRPKQCKTFPWWPMIMKDRKSWEEFKEYCEGIDHPDGKHYHVQEIEESLKK